jgi:hypothetical protein
MDGGNAIDRVREALTASAWADAYEGFRAVDPSELTGRDLEGLADAAWWLSKLPESLDLRHKAYAAYAAEGDEAAAAAVAARLAVEHFLREEPSVGAGFLMRAQRHADGLPDGREVGFLAMVEASVAGQRRSRASRQPAGAIEPAGVRLNRPVAIALHTEARAGRGRPRGTGSRFWTRRYAVVGGAEPACIISAA